MRSTIWVCLATFLLTACSTFTPQYAQQRTAAPTQVAWQNREQKLSRLQSWQVNGKIALQTPQDSGTAMINWWQNRQQYSISLTGPMGANALKLSGGPGHVTMITANGQQSSAASPEQLLERQGWHLPVSSLQYWIRGMPVPGIPANTQFDSYNRVTSLSQQGTRIQYLGYINRNGMELPQRINIYSPSLNARIVIYNWNT